MLVILASFAYMIWGVMTQGFFIMELSTVFIMPWV